MGLLFQVQAARRINEALARRERGPARLTGLNGEAEIQVYEAH